MFGLAAGHDGEVVLVVEEDVKGWFLSKFGHEDCGGSLRLSDSATVEAVALAPLVRLWFSEGESWRRSATFMATRASLG